MVHLDFLFETNSITDIEMYQRLKNNYDTLSKRINKFIQWVEENLNDLKTAKSNTH